MGNKEETIYKFDERGNCIYYKNSVGREYWRKFDKNNNCVYYKNFIDERWYKYDENNKLIYCKISDGREVWYKQDRNNKNIYITEKEYKEIEFRKKEKEYLSRTKCSRFEIMDI